MSAVEALVLEPHEQVGLRELLIHLSGAHSAHEMTIALERRGLTNPLIATCEDPSVGEASFLVSTGTFAELREYPRT